MSLFCYAQRLLNPFRGVINVIRYQSAEAVTLDGVQWDIYVANEALNAGLKGRAQISDIRYGNWSEAAGLKRGPIYPSDDFKRMELQGQIVYDYLRQHHREVPFAFADGFELWLLDADRLPLALIHSALTEEETEGEVPLQWRAGFAAEEAFRSAAAGAGNAAFMLSLYLNSRARGWQWIARDVEGAGFGLRGSAGTQFGQDYDADCFPARFLDPAQHIAPYDRLVADYLDWQAPWLLLLDTLSEATRRETEIRARLRAAEMVRQHRLYPAVADPAQLRAAMVEMVLRQKRAAQPEAGGNALSPFYLELNPQGGGYT